MISAVVDLSSLGTGLIVQQMELAILDLLEERDHRRYEHYTHLLEVLNVMTCEHMRI